MDEPEPARPYKAAVVVAILAIIASVSLTATGPSAAVLEGPREAPFPGASGSVVTSRAWQATWSDVQSASVGAWAIYLTGPPVDIRVGPQTPAPVTCRRCKRTLPLDPQARYSHEIRLELPAGHPVFSGCVFCMAEVLASAEHTDAPSSRPGGDEGRPR